MSGAASPPVTPRHTSFRQRRPAFTLQAIAAGRPPHITIYGPRSRLLTPSDDIITPSPSHHNIPPMSRRHFPSRHLPHATRILENFPAIQHAASGSNVYARHISRHYVAAPLRCHSVRVVLRRQQQHITPAYVTPIQRGLAMKKVTTIMRYQEGLSYITIVINIFSTKNTSRHSRLVTQRHYTAATVTPR